jgi:hypothetical protein
MEASKNSEAPHSVVRKMMAGGADIQTSEWVEFVEVQNDGFRTGPTGTEVGTLTADQIFCGAHVFSNHSCAK